MIGALLRTGCGPIYSGGIYTAGDIHPRFPTMTPGDNAGLSTFEYHVLLALASGPLHGYAVKDAVASESGGTLEPRAGSMYRVIARLMTSGLVAEVDPEPNTPPHPGLPRKYYAHTAPGRAALAAEARRLARSAMLAEKRLGIARSRS